MEKGENCACPGRSVKVYDAGAEYMHALRVNTPYCKAGEGRALFEGAEPQEGGGRKGISMLDNFQSTSSQYFS